MREIEAAGDYQTSVLLVAGLSAEGVSNREIARALNVAPTTSAALRDRAIAYLWRRRYHPTRYHVGAWGADHRIAPIFYRPAHWHHTSRRSRS
jgi:hypothetical protein